MFPYRDHNFTWIEGMIDPILQKTCRSKEFLLLRKNTNVMLGYMCKERKLEPKFYNDK